MRRNDVIARFVPCGTLQLSPKAAKSENMKTLEIFGTIGVMGVALLGCADTTKPIPQPRPVAIPAPRPLPPIAPVAPQKKGDWTDWAYSTGTWAFRKDDRGTLALYGVPGQSAHLLVRCDRQEQRIFISRAGLIADGTGSSMSIRTTTALQSFAVANSGAGYVAAALAPRNPHLDAMAFSRGRFLVSVAGAEDLILPAWPELTRVIEDCR